MKLWVFFIATWQNMVPHTHRHTRTNDNYVWGLLNAGGTSDALLNTPKGRDYHPQCCQLLCAAKRADCSSGERDTEASKWPVHMPSCQLRAPHTHLSAVLATVKGATPSPRWGSGCFRSVHCLRAAAFGVDPTGAAVFPPNSVVTLQIKRQSWSKISCGAFHITFIPDSSSPGCMIVSRQSTGAMSPSVSNSY